MPPGAIVLSQTRQVDPVRGSDGPPTGFLDNLGAGSRVATDTWSESIEGRKHGEYETLIKALEERGIDRKTLGRGDLGSINVLGLSIPIPRTAASDYDPQKVFDAAVAAGIKLPKTREEFELGIVTRNGGRARDQSILARGQGVGATVGALAGQSAADMADSDLGPLQLMVGGGGKTVAQAFLREGVFAALEEVVKQPERINNRQQLGEQTTAAEIAIDIGGSFVFAGVLGAGGKVIGDNWDAIKAAPKAVQERACATILERTPGLAEKVGSKVDWDALNPHLAHIAEATIDRTRMTDAERGAINVLRREVETDAGNPFVPDGAGTQSHYRLLGDTLQGIINDTPVYVPTARPSPSARLRTGTSVATGVSGDAMQTVKARIGVVESGGSATAKNPRSSAMGLYQFTDGTWLAYYKARFGDQGLSDAQIIAKKRDAGLQNTLMDDLLADNAKALQDAGFRADAGNLYLAHFAGRKGATGLLGADPATPAVRVLGQKVIDANPFLRGKTAGEVVAWAHGKMGGKAPAMPARGEAAAPADVIGALDRELADTEADLARLDSEMAAGARSVGDSLDETAPDVAAAAVPVADIEPLARIDAPDGTLAPAGTDGRATVAGMTPEARGAIPVLKGIAERERDLSLNDMASLSARAGVDERNLRLALQQMAIDGLVIQKRDGSFTRLPRPKDGPMDVLTYVASRGGVTPKGFSQSLMAKLPTMENPPRGHDLGKIFEVAREVRWKRKPSANDPKGIPLAEPYWTTRPALIPGYGPIVRSTGRGLDEIGEDLWEAGYFGAPDSAPRPTENDVLNLLQEAFGSGKKVYSVFDQARAADLEQATLASGYADPKNPFASDFQSDEHFIFEWNQFDSAADEAFGITLDEQAFITAWGEYRQAGDGDIRGAVLRGIQREIDDVQAREIAERGLDDAEDIIAEWEAALRGDGILGGEEGGRPDFEPGDPGPSGPPRGPAEWEEEGPLDPERWQAWDEPDGPAATIDTASMEHDLRVQVASDQNPQILASDAPAVDPAIAGRQRQEAQLRAAAPLRGENRTGQAQDGTMGAPLFDAVDQVAFRLDEEGDVVNPADLLAEFDEETAFIKTVRDCL